MPKSEIRWYI